MDVKELCIKIEGYMKSYSDNLELLYEKTTQELNNVSFDSIFIRMDTVPLFRVRLNERDNDLFLKKQDLFYAPSQHVHNYGRVNKPGQSMFYCSEDSSICNLELLYDYLLKNDIGHERYATYSEWELQEEVNLLILAIAPTHREYVNGFTIRNDCFQFVKSEPIEKQKAYSNLYKLTSRFFLENAKNDYSVYVVCSAIANYFTSQFPNVDGVIYPTVQGNTGYNIVLRPHVLDNKMILPKKDVTMEKWIVSNKNKMTIDPYSKKVGQINDDVIKWD
ncbi:MAG: RES domain-containing protein [Bacteroidia bacterium]